MFFLFTHTILLLLRTIQATSIINADGVNFEDSFKHFEESQWRKDYSWRHCGSSVGCMWASDDNLKYISHVGGQHLETNELMISMRNDCSAEFCCRNQRHCTSYTSGQITSKHAYSYGSFHFNLRVTKQSKDYSWTCFDHLDYIASGDTISQVDFPVDLSPIDVVSKCKRSCLKSYDDCVAFWYQQHPTIHVCNFKRTAGDMTNQQPGHGAVCTLKRANDPESSWVNVQSPNIPHGQVPNGAQLATPEVQNFINTTMEMNEWDWDLAEIPEIEDYDDVPPSLEDANWDYADNALPGESEDHVSLYNEQEDTYSVVTTEMSTEAPYTTSEATSTTTLRTRRESTLQRLGAQFCIALLGIAVAEADRQIEFMNDLVRISMCLSGTNNRRATLVSRYGDELYRENVDLPFDASREIGRYSINWQPDHIVWSVNRQPLAELHHGISTIPNVPLHIKLYVAPQVPEQSPSELVENQLHLYSVGYTKFSPEKTELFVDGETVNYPRFLILSASIFLAVCLGICFRRLIHVGPPVKDQEANTAKYHLMLDL